MKPLLARVGVLTAAALLVATTAAVPPAASAAQIGTLTFSSGINDRVWNSQDDTFFATTSGPCPAGGTNFLISVTGPGVPAVPNDLIQGNTAGSTLGGVTVAPFSAPVAQTLSGFATTKGIVGGYLGEGTYTLTLTCRSALASASLGDFVAQFTVTGSGPSSVVGLPAPTAETSVNLGVSAPTAAWGQSVTLTATVANLDAPATSPTGTVQFVNGTVDIGAPVALFNGVATTTVSNLPVGVSSLIAEYVPGAAPFGAGTSAPVTVAISVPAPALVRTATLGGAARVGRVIVCNPGSWVYATHYTYAILRNGVAVQTSTTDNNRLLTPKDLNYAYSCRVTAANTTGSTATATGAVRVVAGPASVARVKPRILGSRAVGKKLTASRGAWSPAATSYVFIWRSGTKVLKSGTAATTYVIPKRLRGKTITLTVVAKRVGYLDGKAVSAGVRVR